MKVIISSQVVLSKTPEGPIAAYLGRFADSLSATGYSVKWIHRQVFLAACFSRWLGQKAVALQDISARHLTLYLQYRARSTPPRCGDHAALAHLIDFLRREGIVPHESPEPDRCRAGAPVEHVSASRPTLPAHPNTSHSVQYLAWQTYYIVARHRGGA